MLGYLVGVEVDDTLKSATPEEIRLRLAGAPNWMEGVNKIECDYLGEVEVVDDK